MNDEKVRPFLTRPAVIDWLQWNDFGEHLVKPDMAQVALSLIEEYRVALRESQAEVTRLREAAKMALDEHYKYAKECRADWSNYDGRSHLAHARYIQNLYDEALKETKP